jgi:tetraprenyl-beta-curcumene synthase
MTDVIGARLQARALVALWLASVRYLRTVGPLAGAGLAHWRTRARAIEDPELRALALRKIDREGFNAEAGAMLATLAPAEHRAQVVKAIVALELLFDLLDGLTERSFADPLSDGRELFAQFVDALRAPLPAEAAPGADEGYIGELAAAAHLALLGLPAVAAVRELAVLHAQRAAEAQVRMHAVSALGDAQLEHWARAQAEASGGSLAWREQLAGSAASVLTVHALIAAAADRSTTSTDAEQIGAAYLPICALVTLLDGLLDREQDRREGRAGYLSVYPDASLPARTLPALARRAATLTAGMPDGAHHLAMLAGAAAYYLSAPGARAPLLRSATAGLRRQLAPLILSALAVMRLWRLTRRLRERPQAHGAPAQGDD